MDLVDLCHQVDLQGRLVPCHQVDQVDQVDLCRQVDRRDQLVLCHRMCQVDQMVPCRQVDQWYLALQAVQVDHEFLFHPELQTYQLDL